MAPLALAAAAGGFAAGCAVMAVLERKRRRGESPPQSEDAYKNWARNNLPRLQENGVGPGKARVPIFVMMPLDTITEDGMSVKDVQMRKPWLQGLYASGVRGVMVDVWWGLCEPAPGAYKWDGYLELCKILQEIGLKMQAVMSFHQCGGNVGDSLTIPIPGWALTPAEAGGLLYKDGQGRVSKDCLSLSADREAIFEGPRGRRDALSVYHQYMAAFARAFDGFLGNTIVEIQVGMGPCGELRYPSYMLSEGWNYPGVGLLCAHDAGMQKMLATAAKEKSVPDQGKVPSGEPKDQNGSPEDCELFRKQSASFRSGHGAFFLRWYHQVLLEHGEAVLREACSAFPEKLGDAVGFSVKVSGIHWHTMHPSRAAEACAGYVPDYDVGFGAYASVARMLGKVAKEAKRPVWYNFTCLEMGNNWGMPEADSAPEDLIAEVRRACIAEGVPLCGENALCFGLPECPEALRQIALQARGWAKGTDRMHSITLLRLDEGFARASSLAALKRWIQAL